ncbi:MAG: nucleotidyl transferase AbiEii/AbiGii toxin family protein [bacterium]
MKSDIIKAQKEILDILADRINEFYLAGGTALSLFYFNHRLSDDLDFFTQEFHAGRIREIAEYIKKKTEKDITLVGQNLSKTTAEIMVYNLELGKEKFLKIDFVKDIFSLIKSVKDFNGIKVLSIEDIYLRKIYATTGLRIDVDEIGRSKFVGGRQEAKDLFDIYFLSKEFLSLADFIDEFCGQVMKEGIIRWFRTFKRLEMKIELADIKTDKKVDFREIDRHLAGEIEKILVREIE